MKIVRQQTTGKKKKKENSCKYQMRNVQLYTSMERKKERKKHLGTIVGNSKIKNQQDSDAIVKTNTVPASMQAIF